MISKITGKFRKEKASFMNQTAIPIVLKVHHEILREAMRFAAKFATSK